MSGKTIRIHLVIAFGSSHVITIFANIRQMSRRAGRRNALKGYVGTTSEQKFNVVMWFDFGIWVALRSHTQIQLPYFYSDHPHTQV